MQQLKEDIQIAKDMIKNDDSRPYEEIRYFLELDRFEPFTEEEWDMISYAIDEERMQQYIYDCMPEYFTMEDL